MTVSTFQPGGNFSEASLRSPEWKGHVETDEDAWDDFLKQDFVGFRRHHMDIDIVGCIHMQVCQYTWKCMYLYVFLFQSRTLKGGHNIFKMSTTEKKISTQS